MGRKIAATAAGVFAAMLVMIVAEVIGHELVVAQRGGQPTVAMLMFVAAGWLLGSFTGALLAQRIDHARLPLPALATGAILLALAVYNLVTLPHPAWFRVLGVFVFLPGTLLGILVARRARRRQDLRRRHA